MHTTIFVALLLAVMNSSCRNVRLVYWCMWRDLSNIARERCNKSLAHQLVVVTKQFWRGGLLAADGFITSFRGASERVDLTSQAMLGSRNALHAPRPLPQPCEARLLGVHKTDITAR